MKITFSIKTILSTLAICLILGFLFVSGYKYRREIDRLNLSLYSSQQTVSAKQIEINGLKQTVYSQEAQVVSSQKAIKQLQDEKEYLKKLRITDVKTISKLELEIEVLKKQGGYHDTIVIVDTITNDVDTIRTASFSDQWSYCKVVLYPNKPEFSFGLTNTPLRVYVGYHGILRNKPTVAVVSPNPYIKLSSLNTVIVEDKKKLLQKKYPYLLAGFLGGWLLFK